MRKPFRLLIAVPCMDYVHADFMKSLTKLTNHLQREGINHEVEIVPGTLIYYARDKLACKAVNENFTHLLFLDSDMVFDTNIVETLTFCGKDSCDANRESDRRGDAEPNSPPSADGAVQNRPAVHLEGL